MATATPHAAASVADKKLPAATPGRAEDALLAGAVNATPLLSNGQIAAFGVPAVTLHAVDSHATKLGLDPAVFVVTRSGDVGSSLRVHYTTSGSAIADVDYEALPGFVDIPEDALATTITIRPLPPPGGTETQQNVRVTLAEDAEYVLGSPSTTSVMATIHPGPPPGGTALLPADPLRAFALLGGGVGVADMSIVPVSGMPFTEALRVNTYIRPVNPWFIQLNTRITAPVEQGDVALATFYVRAVNPDAEVVTDLIVERNGSPYTKSAEFRTSAGDRWERIDVPFVFAETYGVSGASVNFRVGFDPQQLEIGGIRLTNYANTLTLANLPSAPISYLGREPDAAWRAEAAQRIDKYRKADLTILVQDSEGNPLPDASVTVNMWRHGFNLGSAVSAARITEQSPDGDMFRYVVSNFFNRVTLENDLKWPSWENLSQRPRTMQALDWLAKYGIQVRGHNLLWPRWQSMPPDVQGLADDPPALRDRINNHLWDEAGTLAGRLVDWDVVNEPYCCHVLTDILGMPEMVEWFNLTRQADPYARLYINDYSILSGRGLEVAHQDAYFDTIQYLLSQGAALDGIGLQSHFSAGLTRPTKLLEILDRFASLGLLLQSTEFDIAVREEQVQADYLRDFMTLLFSHPSVDGIVMWGFWEASHWKPEAALFRRDWSLKPNGQQWLDLVYSDWWTNAGGTTDGQGAYQARGFHGEYGIEVNYQGRQQLVSATLAPGGATVVVTV